MMGPLPPFPIPLNESGVRNDKMDNPNRMQRYVRLCDRLVVGVREVSMLEDQHADETEVEMTREEMEARFEELEAWMKERALGEPDFENRCGEYFELKRKLDNNN